VAVVTPEIAVIARPGAEARRGETEHIREALAAFRPLAEIAAPGTLEGGDVLQVERTVFIGLSGRTNEEGAGQLARILQPFGYEVHTLPLRRGLHLKSAVNYLGRNTLLLTREWAEHPLFAAYKKIVVPPQEAYAANTLLVNGRLLAPDGYPETAAMLREAGFEVLELVVSEARKMDGGLTCMSLRL
jgi:dimethylargininase